MSVGVTCNNEKSSQMGLLQLLYCINFIKINPTSSVNAQRYTQQQSYRKHIASDSKKQTGVDVVK
jgi:hypothetical protein